MNIAIIGAGFSGIAIAWHLMHRDGNRVTLFDAKGIGAGASGIAAGLLHPYAGLHCKLNWKGREGVQATKKLLDAAGESVYATTGLMRIALNETAEKDYASCAERYPEEVVWLEPQETQTLIPQAVRRPAIFIKPAITVHSDRYLQALWAKIEGQFIQAEISSLGELHNFDRIIVANGAMAGRIKELSDIPITLVKGQILELSWPQHLPPLPLPLNSQAYIMMTPGNRSCLVGATYERDFSSVQPDAAAAAADLLPKALAMVPGLKDAQIIGCRAAVRASAPYHRPYLKRLDGRCWVLTGMGSKGLLYHALFAQQLVDEITLGPYT